MLLNCSEAVALVFVTCTVLEVDVPTNWLPKTRLPGNSFTVVPVPPTLTVCGPPLASLIFSTAERKFRADGENRTATVHVPPGGSEPALTQLSLSRKSDGLSPVKFTLVTGNAVVVLVLLMTMLCAVEALPISWD